ncbi:unnamed protein product, partial [Onchocerca ochengi]|uniref:Glycosyltransferase family 2 protein n=1 Tax=Onchocerca ochengi TaxID=42157 RepID=A0A182EYS2_ONCOC
MHAADSYQHRNIRRFPIAKASSRKNNLVRLFKTIIDMMPSDTYKIVIHADEIPAGEQ